MDISSKELFGKRKWVRAFRSLKVGTHRVPLEGLNEVNIVKNVAFRLNKYKDELNTFDVSVSTKTNIATITVKRRE